MSTAYSFKRGETIIIDLVVTDPGTYDPSTLTVIAKVKPAINSTGTPPAAAPYTTTMNVTYNPAVGAAKAFWRLSAPAGVLATPGFYVCDAEVFSGSTVLQVTSPIIIQCVESVTPA